MIGQRLNTLEIAQSLLDGVVDHYAAHSDPEVEPLPARRIIAAGDPANIAWDCEQLTVSTQGVGHGQSDDTAPPSAQMGVGAGVFGMRHVIFEVSLVRCIATQNGPKMIPDTTLMREGVRYMRDVGMLSQALTEIASRIRRDLAPEGVVRPSQILPAGPDGAFVAAVGIFQISSTRLL